MTFTFMFLIAPTQKKIYWPFLGATTLTILILSIITVSINHTQHDTAPYNGKVSIPTHWRKALRARTLSITTFRITTLVL
jgi:hypothetical protein